MTARRHQLHNVANNIRDTIVGGVTIGSGTITITGATGRYVPPCYISLWDKSVGTDPTPDANQEIVEGISVSGDDITLSLPTAKSHTGDTYAAIYDVAENIQELQKLVRPLSTESWIQRADRNQQPIPFYQDPLYIARTYQ